AARVGGTVPRLGRQCAFDLSAADGWSVAARRLGCVPAELPGSRRHPPSQPRAVPFLSAGRGDRRGTRTDAHAYRNAARGDRLFAGGQLRVACRVARTASRLGAGWRGGDLSGDRSAPRFVLGGARAVVLPRLFHVQVASVAASQAAGISEDPSVRANRTAARNGRLNPAAGQPKHRFRTAEKYL